jgi:3-deoxy-manno-octulosonate cytidylyltransferase (CMP-KDO synthetase)
MKIAIIIPARMSSTRLPGKPLMEIGGRPMVIHVWDRMRKMRGVDDVFIATPDGEIAEAASRYGAAFIMTSERCRSGTDRVAEAAEKVRADVIANVQGDEPLIDRRHVKKAIDTLLAARGSVMSTLRCPVASESEMQDRNAVKVVTDSSGRALYFSRSPVPFFASAPVTYPTRPADPWGRHIGTYVYRRKFLMEFASMPRTPLEKAESLEQLRALENGYPVHVGFVPGAERGVDTAEDLLKARQNIGRSG